MGAVAEQALEAAALLIQEGAADRLTLENVAAASELPMSEIEQRWPTVEDFVVAVGERAYGTYLKNIADAMGADESPGAFLRAYAEASFPTDRERDNFVMLVTTLFQSAPLRADTFDPVRAKQREIDCALTSDGLDPVMARILRYALDGLYFSDVFGLTPLTADERAEMLTRIRMLAQPQPEPADQHLL